jgi:glucosamine-6-phosphate deaminase
VYPTQDDAVPAVGDRIVSYVKSHPTASITYATGNTMIPLYKYIASKVELGEVDFSETVAFHLDEYFPISQDNPHGFVNYLYERVFVPFKLQSQNIHTLSGQDPDFENTVCKYNELLRGGVDLCILGIGPGSHMGFNEGGTPFDSVTHLAKLSKETVYRDRIERNQDTPGEALTQGIKNILDSKEIILSAYGNHNAENIHNAFFEEVSTNHPASALQTVGNKVTVIIDRLAAGRKG